MLRHLRPLGADLGATLRLAAPLVLATAGNQLLGVADTVIVGHLGAVPLAGTGLANALYFLATFLPLGLMMGLDPLAAQAVGAGRRAQARRHLREAELVALAISLPVVGLCFGASALALPALGIDPATSDAVHQYLLGRSPAVLPMLVYMAQRGYMQAEGLTHPVWISALAANVVNVPLSCVLTFGDDALTWAGLPAMGLPALGVFGAGLGTTIVTAMQVAVMAAAIKGAPPPGDRERPTWRGVRQLLRVGGPLGVLFLAEGGLFGTVSLLMGRFGPVHVAAHQVAVQLASVTFTVCLGLGGATAARVGLAVGRGDAAGTRRAGFAGIGSAVCFMGVTALGFALFARPLATLVAKPPEVVEAAIPLLHMAAVFQVFDGTQAVSAAALRGAADTRAAMIAGIVGHWALGFVLSVGLAFGLGMGPIGLWWGLVLGLGATATFLSVRFERISRRRIAAVA